MEKKRKKKIGWNGKELMTEGKEGQELWQRKCFLNAVQTAEREEKQRY